VEDAGAERPRAVAADEEVDAPHVIRLEDDGERRRAGVEPSPELVGVVGRHECVDKGHVAAGLDARRSHWRLPAKPWFPVRIVRTPDPEARSNVAELDWLAPDL
jgi:hypothetical protein